MDSFSNIDTSISPILSKFARTACDIQNREFQNIVRSVRIS